MFAVSSTPGRSRKVSFQDAEEPVVVGAYIVATWSVPLILTFVNGEPIRPAMCAWPTVYSITCGKSRRALTVTVPSDRLMASFGTSGVGGSDGVGSGEGSDPSTVKALNSAIEETSLSDPSPPQEEFTFTLTQVALVAAKVILRIDVLETP